ncbi:ileal sodium/bile acid cotransporter-like [Cherax quadricarinatus]|uniref:ileal sodium/bile acid cotransporter-like n=1 Tax=Cherax quadricarinatus TaxID=27406 RepID=UPI00387EDFD9
MTTCSSIMALLGMPVNLWMYSQYWLHEGEDSIVVPYVKIITSLALITIPVVTGMVIRHFKKRVASIITKVAGLLGWLGIMVCSIVGMMLYGRLLITASPLIYVGAAILPLAGFTLSYVIAKLTCRSHKVCCTIGIETGCQNLGIAYSIVSISFPDPVTRGQIIVFPVLYYFILSLELLLGIFFLHIYKKRCSFQDQPQVDVSMTYTAKTETGTAEERQPAIVTD